MAAPATATTVTVVVQTVAAAAPSVEGRNIGSAGELILIPWKLSRFKSDYIKFRAFVRFWLMQGYRSRSLRERSKIYHRFQSERRSNVRNASRSKELLMSGAWLVHEDMKYWSLKRGSC